MKYEEFLRQLGKAGLTTREFAELIKIHPKSVTNCGVKGVSSNLAIIAALMADMAESKLDFKLTLSKIDIEHNKPRGSGFKKKTDE